VSIILVCPHQNEENDEGNLTISTICFSTIDSGVFSTLSHLSRGQESEQHEVDPGYGPRRWQCRNDAVTCIKLSPVGVEAVLSRRRLIDQMYYARWCAAIDVATWVAARTKREMTF
jgi:hypothetical protein